MAKRAVLIGINRYQVPGADLRGCVNDVKNLEQALRAYYGFSAQDITSLTDLKATKKAMQSAIQKLIASGKKGDILFLHYSGHGSNVPDDNGGETDHRDKTLCPTDLDWYDSLGYNWLSKTFNKLRSGVSLTVIMDCCHSGANIRAFQPRDAPIIERFLPCPLDLCWKRRGKLRGRKGGASGERPRKDDIVHADIPGMLITSCRDWQTSADAHIGGTFNGALTYYLVESIKETRGNLTYRELHQHTTAKLKNHDFNQVPQLESRRDRWDSLFLSPLV
ncbi:MAG: caspase family protein [Nitrospira sp.]